MKSTTTQIGVRLDDELLRRVDRATVTLAPPLPLTRSDAVRMLLYSALQAHEQSLPPSQPQDDGDGASGVL